MAEANLDIKIRTTADTTGATAAAASLKGVEAASTGTTAASRKLYDATQKQSTGQKAATEQTLKGGEALEKLRNAATGGAGGIMAIIPALKGLGAAFMANPITAGIAVFLLLKDYAAAGGSALGDLIVKSRGVADGLSGIGLNAATTAANLAEVKSAGDTALKQIAADAKTAADDIERFYKGVDEASARLDKLADAATAAKLAELDLAEAQALAGAGTETEREGIRQSFTDQRGTVRRAAAAASEDRTRRFETERVAGATDSAAAASGRIDSAQSAYNTAAQVLADQLAKNKGLNASTPEGQEGLRLATLARAEAETKARALDDAKKANAPIIEQAQSQRQLGETNLKILDSQAKTTAAKEKTATVTDSAGRAGRMQAARAADETAALTTAAAAQVRGTGDLNADQEKQVVQRALEINRNAAAQAGTQAGETIGEAFGMALKELFPEVTNAILINVRSQINEAVKAESARINARLDQSDARARNERR